MNVKTQKYKQITFSVLLSLCLLATLFMGFGKLKGEAQVLGDNYPYPWEQHSQVDPWNFYKGECTSFVAWRMNTANQIQFTNNSVEGKSTHLGNAKNWGSALKNLGYTVDNNPAVGAIAWQNTGTYGHVGWVAEVNGDKVTVEDYNYHPEGSNDTYKWRYHCRSNMNKSAWQYIHVKDLAPQKNADPGQQTILDGRYHIVSQLNDNYNLDVSGVSKDAGANIQLWESRNVPEQTFNVRWLGNGYYKIINANSGKALEVSGANPNAGANVHQWNEHEGEAEQWVIRQNGDGSYSIICRWGSHAIDVKDAAVGNGINIQTWDINNSAAQNFYFVEYAGQTIPDGRYYISPKADTSLVLAVAGQSKSNAANVEICSKSSRKGHTWDVKHLGYGYYSIINTNSNMSLDVADANRGNAVNVQQMPFVDNNNAQQWIIKANGDGSYRIVAKCGGRDLDIAGGNFTSGTNVQMYNRNDMDAQKWVFEEYIPPVTIKLDPNGGYWRKTNSTSPKSFSADSGKSTSLSNKETPISDNHKVFAGWSSKKNDTSGNYMASITTDKDTTLYAQWKDVDPANAIIILDGNGGRYSTSNSAFALFGKTELTLTEFKKGEVLPSSATGEGGYFGADVWKSTFKTLAGWYKDSDLTEQFNPQKDKVTGDMVLYAKWDWGTSPLNPEEPTTQKEEPTTQQAEPTTKQNEEPTSQKNEEPISQKNEEPTSQKNEEPTSQKNEEPTSQKNEEPTSKKNEEPTSKKNEEPTSKKNEEPTSKKNEEPTSKKNEEPTSQKNEEPTVLNGIVKGPDGKWAMYKNNKVDTSYTGVAKNKYGWWRVEKGYVNFKANGIYKNEYGWWKTTDGKVTFKETGVFKNEYGWWRVEDSKVNFKANGIYKNQYGWWKTTNGKVTFKENGVFKNEYGWWKVKDSKVDFNFTGIAKNKYGSWYVKNGKVDFNKNGKVTYNGTTYTVKNGKVQ